MNNETNSQIVMPITSKTKAIEGTKKQAIESSASEESETYQFLRTHSTFSKLSIKELKVLADCSRFENLDSGEYIAVEGDEENLRGFIVVAGRLSMLKTSISGKELVVQLLAPGDIFGLLVSLSVENLPAQLSARAQSKSKVLWMPVKNLVTVLDAHPLIYREFVAYLLHSLQSAYRISRGLAHDRVEVRIATLLISLALKFSRQPPPADHNTTIDITRQQIADLTGTTPETAIRVTRNMQREGLIDIKRPGIVRILDLDAILILSEQE